MASFGVRRLLNTRPLLELFLSQIMQDDEIAKTWGREIAEVVEVELALDALEKHPTATHDDYRDPLYRGKHDREKLCEEILKELVSKERLDDDDKIILGSGGAKPKTLRSESQAYIINGPPASGKSGVASFVADTCGAYILDSDYAKRKFPEYSTFKGGASLVHDESDKIIFGESNSLFEYCVCEHYNMVIPLVGRNCKSLLNVCKRIQEKKYSIHLINVTLDRAKCTSRAFHRFLDTKRYVPLSYVFDEVANTPETSYFKIKRDWEGKGLFESFAQLSTDVPRGEPARVEDCTPNSPIANYYRAKEVELR